MNSEMVIRQATKEDLPLIQDLVNSMYRIKRSTDFLQWQCFDNINPTVLIGGFHNKSLMGMFGIQKRILSNGIICGQASWLNISPTWQRRGLFTQLGHAALNYFSDIDVLCVFANSNAKYPCEKSFGIKNIGIIKMMLLKSLKGISKPLESFTVQTIDANTMFPSVEENSSKFISFKYSQRYRKWRYASSPIYKYTLIALTTGEFIIVKKFIDPVSHAHFGDIVDFGCPPEKGELIKKLYAVACWYLKNEGVEKISTWAMHGSKTSSVVNALGFEVDIYGTYFGFKSLNPAYDRFYDFSQWHLRQADATNY